MTTWGLRFVGCVKRDHRGCSRVLGEEVGGCETAAVDDFAVKRARIGIAFYDQLPRAPVRGAQVRDSFGTDVRRR